MLQFMQKYSNFEQHITISNNILQIVKQIIAMSYNILQFQTAYYNFDKNVTKTNERFNLNPNPKPWTLTIPPKPYP